MKSFCFTCNRVKYTRGHGMNRNRGVQLLKASPKEDFSPSRVTFVKTTKRFDIFFRVGSGSIHVLGETRLPVGEDRVLNRLAARTSPVPVLNGYFKGIPNRERKSAANTSIGEGARRLARLAVFSNGGRRIFHNDPSQT